LGGTPSTGGVWVDNSKPLEESVFDGILNAQLIRSSGVYTYTYVQDPSVCTDNEATITIIIGPYTGVPSPNVSTCDDIESFNLFQAFDGTKLPPLINGVWNDDDNAGTLSGNFINPKVLGVGTYSYTYTIPALDTCPEQSATISVSIFPKPKSGIKSDLILCSTDNLSLYSNLNLNDLIFGEDSGGKWTENGTNELSGSNDNKINVENIYNTLGAGNYSFTYTVLSSNPICTNSQSTVSIIIEDPIDFTGATLVVNSDICEDEIATATYTAILTKGAANIPSGNYSVTYTLSNGITTNTFSEINQFVNGKFLFDIDSSYLQNVGNYNVTITNIVLLSSLGVCTNILGTITDDVSIYPIPKINNATLKIDPICKGFDAVVEISGNTNLTDGGYKITYDLSGDNTASNQQVDFTVTSGVGSFIIPANLIPIVGINSIINITRIENLATTCANNVILAKGFIVKPLPDVSGITLNISNVCLDQDATVQLSGLGSLINITLDYSISGSNTALDQNITLTVNSGNASFVIPASALTNTGTTTLALSSLIDNSNGCSSIILNKTKDFIINTIPSNPVTNSFSFCKNDAKTIANLLPNGSQYQWFDSVSSTTALSISTVLVNGNYYVKEVNSATGCESGRTVIDVTINELDIPTLDTDGQNFCGLDKPTIQDLIDRTTVDDILVWYDAAENGNQLDASTLLKDGLYYGYNFSSVTNCYSNALEVTVSLSNCDVTPDFFVPDGFSPNRDGVNDTFRIPNIEFIYPNFTLEIYNRYGNLLFKGNKDKLEWDGRNSYSKIGIDGIAPNGVYFYVLNLNKDNKKPIQGRLYLNR
jgi:gliding motility-associated-like protein